MTTDYVLSLADKQATLETTGGKGASLARLSAAGMPVPDGFHVTTEGYRRFVAENGLQPGILAALQTVRPAQAGTLEAGCRAYPCPVHRQSDSHRSRQGNPGGLHRPDQSLLITYHSALGRRRAVLGHRRGPARSQLRRPARELPQHPRRRGGAGRGEALLGLAMDGSRHRLPPPARRFDGWAEPGRGCADSWCRPTPRVSSSPPTPSPVNAIRR